MSVSICYIPVGSTEIEDEIWEADPFFNGFDIYALSFDLLLNMEL